MSYSPIPTSRNTDPMIMIPEENTVFGCFPGKMSKFVYDELPTQCTYKYRGFTFMLNKEVCDDGKTYHVTEESLGVVVLKIMSKDFIVVKSNLKNELSSKWDSFLREYKKFYDLIPNKRHPLGKRNMLPKNNLNILQPAILTLL